MSEYGLKQNNVNVVINADLIEESAKQQIEVLAKHPAFHGLISIMPDVHLGKGSVIGFTGKFKDCVIPNVVGVDIGCGVSCYELGKLDIDFAKLDIDIRKKIPLGF
jgi:tRNA-splicing ligase RtcB